MFLEPRGLVIRVSSKFLMQELEDRGAIRLDNDLLAIPEGLLPLLRNHSKSISVVGPLNDEFMEALISRLEEIRRSLLKEMEIGHNPEEITRKVKLFDVISSSFGIESNLLAVWLKKTERISFMQPSD